MSDPLGLISSTQNSQPVQPRHPQHPAQPGQQQGPSFKQVLMENIDQVNKLQQDAEKAIEDLSAGRRDDVANVMIAKNKADAAFKMLLQVRNKMNTAYEEIKQIRV